MTDNNGLRNELVELTADVVAAYVSNNPVQTGDLPVLIREVHSSLDEVLNGKPAAPRPEPAVDPKRSVKHDHIVCLDDGRKFKSLKRHLNKLGMTPDEYREKWGLPFDYPMVAPDYAAKRSQLAKDSGLGTKANRKGARSAKR